jgi:glyoxylase-like metal-dependent hydrolase (beta-lactamase superfamily II)
VVTLRGAIQSWHRTAAGRGGVRRAERVARPLTRAGRAGAESVVRMDRVSGKRTAMMMNMSWSEVAPDVFVRRYLPVDTTISVVRGRDGLLLVDTGGSPAEAAQIEADLEELGGRLRWVVNTHAHFDHTFGNQRFGPGSAADLPIYAHHLVPAHLEEHEGPRLAAWRAGTGSEPPRDWDEVTLTAPSQLVRERSWLDLGDRTVELVPLPPGHTDGDVVVHVPAKPGVEVGNPHDTWIVGDVLEDPGPPMYGSGCFPLR